MAIVREHRLPFRERVEMHAGPLPAFVCDEIEAFATCGDFEHGSSWPGAGAAATRYGCPSFACKSRGICLVLGQPHEPETAESPSRRRHHGSSAVSRCGHPDGHALLDQPSIRSPVRSRPEFLAKHEARGAAA
jgi:hypothetical protein